MTDYIVKPTSSGLRWGVYSAFNDATLDTRDTYAEAVDLAQRRAENDDRCRTVTIEVPANRMGEVTG